MEAEQEETELTSGLRGVYEVEVEEVLGLGQVVVLVEEPGHVPGCVQVILDPTSTSGPTQWSWNVGSSLFCHPMRKL